MTVPTLSIKTLKPNAPISTSADINLLVSISCPVETVIPGKVRPRLNLALAVDKSASMRGNPLDQAKLCVRRVIERLSSGDRVAVISYDAQVNIEVASTEIESDKSGILRAVDAITVRGNTDVHGGWLAAASEAALGLGSGILTRVMLLSDGQTNSGIQDVSEISRQAAALAAKGVATSTIGLGHNFNEDLMTALADAGQGSASYGETADDLWPSFEAELGLLSATFGRSVRLRMISPCCGTVNVENGFRTNEPGVWILPDLVHGADIDAIVRVSVSGLLGLDARVIEVELSYMDMDGKAAVPLRIASVLPLVPFADFVIGVSDPIVAERLKENEAAKIQLAAKAAAVASDFTTVRALSVKLGNMADGNALIAGMASTMTSLAESGDMRLFTKEATYASASLMRGYKAGSGVDDTHTSSFLKRRTRQGKDA